mmetsp:Transcript_83528/g.233085  ORF Transcript_83528/g.233085 Transcript_83528/m.233085 type:complete len:506 (-) Transcript_83528:354-1871(-)
MAEHLEAHVLQLVGRDVSVVVDVRRPEDIPNLQLLLSRQLLEKPRALLAHFSRLLLRPCGAASLRPSLLFHLCTTLEAGNLDQPHKVPQQALLPLHYALPQNAEVLLIFDGIPHGEPPKQHRIEPEEDDRPRRPSHPEGQKVERSLGRLSQIRHDEGGDADSEQKVEEPQNPQIGVTRGETVFLPRLLPHVVAQRPTQKGPPPRLGVSKPRAIPATHHARGAGAAAPAAADRVGRELRGTPQHLRARAVKEPKRLPRVPRYFRGELVGVLLENYSQRERRRGKEPHRRALYFQDVGFGQRHASVDQGDEEQKREKPCLRVDLDERHCRPAQSFREVRLEAQEAILGIIAYHLLPSFDLRPGEEELVPNRSPHDQLVEGVRSELVPLPETAPEGKRLLEHKVDAPRSAAVGHPLQIPGLNELGFQRTFGGSEGPRLRKTSPDLGNLLRDDERGRRLKEQDDHKHEDHDVHVLKRLGQGVLAPFLERRGPEDLGRQSTRRPAPCGDE